MLLYGWDRTPKASLANAKRMNRFALGSNDGPSAKTPLAFFV